MQCTPSVRGCVLEFRLSPLCFALPARFQVVFQETKKRSQGGQEERMEQVCEIERHRHGLCDFSLATQESKYLEFDSIGFNSRRWYTSDEKNGSNVVLSFDWLSMNQINNRLEFGCSVCWLLRSFGFVFLAAVALVWNSIFNFVVERNKHAYNGVYLCSLIYRERLRVYTVLNYVDRYHRD